MSSKKEVKPENPQSFEPDDLQLLNEHKITDQGFHAAWDAAAVRNPPNSCVEPHYRLVFKYIFCFTWVFSDALEEQQAPSAPKSSAQADMDLD
jgi:hypothetical protein